MWDESLKNNSEGKQNNKKDKSTVSPNQGDGR
jgi:hypothetical protein